MLVSQNAIEDKSTSAPVRAWCIRATVTILHFFVIQCKWIQSQNRNYILEIIYIS